LKKWGEGASLIRKEWKTREENGEGGKEEGVVDTKSHRAGRDDEMAVDDEDDDDEEDEDGEEEEDEEPDLEATPRMLPRRTIGVNSPPHPDAHIPNDRDANNDLTNLTETLNSLSIVPNSIRFGRGGKSGGFVPRGQGRARGGRSYRGEADVDVGQAWRGKGRGRGRGKQAVTSVANSVTVTRQ